MNIGDIVQRLKEERGKLDAAIQALEGLSGATPGGKRRGRPPGSSNKAAPRATRKRPTMSAAARKRIADAMKKRWAAAKRAGKKGL